MERTQQLVLSPEDEDTFQKMYAQGLKHSRKNFDETTPVPKFYTKVNLHIKIEW